MNFQGTSFIGAKRGKGKKTCVSAVNPVDGSTLEPSYISATQEEVEEAISIARDAFVIYGKKSGKEKSQFLCAIANNIEGRIEDLVARMPLETGLPEARVRGEAARTIGQLKMFATLIEKGDWVDARLEHAIPEREPLPKPDMRSMNIPLGPVVVFCASNFPLAYSVAGGDVVSALAAGCPVIVKAHSSHPGVAEIVASAVRDAVVSCDLPEGVFSLLYGPGREIGQLLVKHPEIKAVGFTGSQAGGRNLMDIAASRPEPIPVYAEMSAVNPLFIFSSALQEKAEALAAQFYGALTLGAGQFCTNPGLVFLPREGSETFVKELCKLAASGEKMTMLNSTIFKAYQSGRKIFAEDSNIENLVATESSERKCSTNIFGIDISDFLSGNYSEEIFGPASLLVFCSSQEDFISGLRKLGGQLTASVHAGKDDISSSEKIIEVMKIKVGRLIFNGFPTGLEVCHATVHGGPYPATSDGRATSVGSLAIYRFTRLVAYQDFPDGLLPPELQESNPLDIRRLVDGELL